MTPTKCERATMAAGLAVFWVVCGFARDVGARAPEDARRAERAIDAVMRGRLEKMHPNASGEAPPRIYNSVLVVDDVSHRFHYEKAFGIARSGAPEPMTVAHQFPIASVTKTLTATIILQLWEEGGLGSKGLDAPLGELDVFPRGVLDRLDVYHGKSYGAQITIRQLLGHRTGMRDVFMDDQNLTAESNHGVAAPHALGGYILADLARHQECLRTNGCDPSNLWTTRQWVPWDSSRPQDREAGVINFYLNNDASAAQPLFAPNQGYHYSDTGYLILGLVIEKLTGQTLHQAYRARIFDRLRLERTYLDYAKNPPSERFLGRRADYFIGDFGGYTGGLNLSFDWAGGGVVSTAGDLSRLMRALAQGELFRDRATLAEMTRWHWQRLRDGLVEDRGYGVEQIHAPEGSLIWGHFGFWGAAMFYEPATGIVAAGTLDQVGVSQAQWIAAIFQAVHSARAASRPQARVNVR